jgi:hypothetical protein
MHCPAAFFRGTEKRETEMKLQTTSILKVSALALALAAPLMASAESTLTIGSGNATARLNFSVIIPRILYLGVGTGAPTLSNNGTVDTLTFDYSAAPLDVGSGTDSAAQDVTVRVLGNDGQITIASTGPAAGLSNGAGDNIAWTEILPTSSSADLAVPAVGSSSTPTLNGTKWTDRTATWSFAYSNTNLVAPGTYTGQVTYTATMP